MGKDLIVRQSNKLIEAQYQLSLIEKRFLSYLITVVGEKDKQFEWYNVDLPALAEAFPSAHRDIVGQFANVARSLRGKELVVEDPETGVVRRFNWLAADEFDRKNRTVRVSIHPDLMKHLVELKSLYTSYSIANVSRLRSTYSFRLYELLKQVQLLKRRSFDPDKLRRLLGVDDSYARYSNFKQRVLDIAVSEINEHTDIYCEYVARKAGKKVVSLEFTVGPNARGLASNAAARAAAAGALGHAKELLTGRWGFSDKEADAILEEHAEAYVRENLDIVEAKVAEAAAVGKPVLNTTAYARKALLQDWRPKPGSVAAEAKAAAKRAEEARKDQARKDAAEREALAAERALKDRAWEDFMAKDETDREKVMADFERDLSAGRATGGSFVLEQWRATGLESPGAKASFRTWLVKSKS